MQCETSILIGRFVVVQQKEDEVNLLKQEIAKLNKLQEGVQRKLQTSNQQRSDVEKERDGIKNQISSLEKGLLELSNV